jgi:hypothetical protein
LSDGEGVIPGPSSSPSQSSMTGYERIRYLPNLTPIT